MAITLLYERTEVWTNWTQAFGKLARLIRSASTDVAEKVHDTNLATRILNDLHAFYDAVGAINGVFLDEIVAIDTGGPDGKITILKPLL